MESPSLAEADQLAILAKAISDLGYWNWWGEDLPSVFQVEFGRTQLYFPPKSEGLPPNTKIAIRFVNPTSINFLTMADVGEQDTMEWPGLLHADRLDKPGCTYGSFTFTNKERMREMMLEAGNINSIHGYFPASPMFNLEPYRLVFWAGSYGLSIAAEKLILLTMERQVALEEISGLHVKWWDYWRTYWDRMDTETPLPYDMACEVTIPIKGPS